MPLTVNSVVEKDGLLYVGTSCAFYPCRPPSNSREIDCMRLFSYVLPHISRVLAEGEDAKRSSQAIRYAPRKNKFGDLRASLAGLLENGVEVKIVKGTFSPKRLENERDDVLEIFVQDEHDHMRMLAGLETKTLNAVRKTESVNAWLSLETNYAKAMTGFIFHLKFSSEMAIAVGSYRKSLLFPYSTFDICKFVDDKDLFVAGSSRSADAFKHEPGVHLYKSGVLVEVERWDESECLFLDVWEKEGSAGRFPTFDERLNIDEFYTFFLGGEKHELSKKSSIVRSILGAAKGVSAFIRQNWSDCEEERQKRVEILKDPESSDEFCALMDGGDLVKVSREVREHSLCGMSILRRLQTSAFHYSDVDWGMTAIEEFSVCGFYCMPVSKERFSALYKMGCFSSYGEKDVCEHGLITVNERGGRIICLPTSPSASDIAAAISVLIPIESPTSLPFQKGISESECVHIPFSMDMRYEGSTCCLPGEELTLHKIRLDVENGVVLSPFYHGGARFFSSSSLSVDNLCRMPSSLLPTYTDFLRRREVEAFLPRVCTRLGEKKDGFIPLMHSICAEVQARKVCSRWRLESLDEGDNLSSLGLSILLASLLGGWMGMKAAVALTPSHSACVAVWGKEREGDNESFLIVDPCRSNKNIFKLFPFLSLPEMRPARGDERIRKGVLVEVKHGEKWRCAVVERSYPSKGMASVTYLMSGKQGQISASNYSWRRVSQDGDTSDLDKAFGEGKLCAPR